MAYYWEFIRNSDGEAETMVVMDEAICTDLGMEIHPDYAMGFDLVGMFGVMVLANEGGQYTDKEKFDAYLAKANAESLPWARSDDPWAAEQAFRRFLYGDYVVSAWCH